MSPPPGPAALESQIAEHEHQALDLLDAQARDCAESDAVPDGAAQVVRELLPRLVEAVGRTLLDAATELSQTDDRGSLDPRTLDEIRLTLAEQPLLSLAITPAVETTGLLLGLDRDGAAWAMLLELAATAKAEAGEALHACSTAIAERLAAAQPSPSTPEVSRALRVFRSAAVAQAGPLIRARTLAVDHPEHLALAGVLVVQQHDAGALVDAFDAARAALASAAPKPADGPDQMDGPKRKFTYVHVILAMIVLGLTLWHYVWR